MATITIRQNLKPETEKELVSALESGQSLEGACALVYFSFERACVLMGEKTGKGRKFQAIVKRAQSVAELRLVSKIMRDGNPQTCLAMLQVRFDSWNKNIKSDDKDNLKAEALLARMSAIPEAIKKRKG